MVQGWSVGFCGPSLALHLPHSFPNILNPVAAPVTLGPVLHAAQIPEWLEQAPHIVHVPNRLEQVLVCMLCLPQSGGCTWALRYMLLAGPHYMRQPFQPLKDPCPV